jgi:hypothetical protein
MLMSFIHFSKGQSFQHLGIAVELREREGTAHRGEAREGPVWSASFYVQRPRAKSRVSDPGIGRTDKERFEIRRLHQLLGKSP